MGSPPGYVDHQLHYSYYYFVGYVGCVLSLALVFFACRELWFESLRPDCKIVGATETDWSEFVSGTWILENVHSEREREVRRATLTHWELQWHYLMSGAINNLWAWSKWVCTGIFYWTVIRVQKLTSSTPRNCCNVEAVLWRCLES